ncbi:hypothetical protein FC756_00260 [Lysinibacillus mangiferihumi]|uniref:Uncharacterized protein n=1 Tax=Lysinibacillus mangiferihumi TaxID=1130819 RepID=A0A4U2ZFT3_9BACI|nr:hypothetical protein [Lysinibacillus mangiferihumi]TKI72762.1 hypothetical protein FC756_00260 [Lysinibacillus mangiferihumi]
MEREPRLYIKSPTYFLNISKMLHELDLDESTSVYVKDHYDSESSLEEAVPKLVKEQDAEVNEVVDEYIIKQLQFLEKPFRQKAYQPLLITLKDGRRLSGTASDMQMDSLLLTSKEFNTQEIIYFEDIEQILWRGKQLPIL